MNPLKVKATGSPITSANTSGLQTMTDAEVKNYIANVITEKFASVTDGTGTAEINITTNNSGSGTSIGTFVDTTRTESIGTHPATGSVSTTTYTVKQVTAAATENITNRPLVWDSRLEEMTDGDIDSIMDLCVEAMAAESSYTAGQYRLSPTAPTGGTWVSRYTITDTAQGGNTVTYLWQKTAASSLPNSDYTPLKLFNGSNCKQMIESEIEQMLPNFRNRIIDTSIATYKIQSTAPSGGTWIEMGAQFADTREQVSPQTYVGNYSGNFTGNYTGNYIGPFPYSAPYSAAGNFSSNFTGNYAGTVPGDPTPTNFTGNYAGVIPGSPTPGPNYTGYYSSIIPGSPTPANFTGYYSGVIPGSPTPTNFTGNYAGVIPGPNYTGFYSGVIPGSPTPTNFTGFYTGFYSGVIPGSPVPTPYSGPTYTAPPSPGPNYTGFYSGVIPGSPTPGPSYTGYYAGLVSYTGQYAGTMAFSGEYASGVEPGTFQYFTGFFAGIIPGGTFVGYYTDGTQVLTTYTGVRPGPPIAPGEPGDPFVGYFDGLGPAYYAGYYAGGPTPTTYTQGFLGPAPAGPNYIGYYTGPVFYAGFYLGPGGPIGFGGNYAAGNEPPPALSYTGFYAGIIPGSPTPANFTGFYQGSPITYPGYSGTFTGTVPGSPIPTNFSGTYTGFYAGVIPGSPTFTTFTGYYQGAPTPTNFTGFYAGVIPGSPTFTTFTGNYAGVIPGSPTPGPAYTGNYAGVIPGSPTPTNYTGFYSGVVPGSPTPANFTGFYTGFFSGVGVAYTGFYSGPKNYSGTYSGSYINSFTGNYSGATIQATKDTVSTIKLWIRTA